MKWQAMLTIAGLMAAASAVCVAAGPQVTLELGDGSRLRGLVVSATIGLATPRGKTDVPVGQIRTLAFVTKSVKGETWREAVVTLRNGDRIQGRITKRNLDVKTPYGQVSVPIRHIERIEWLPIDATAGLVAFWSADGNARDVAGGHHGTVGKGVCYTADRHDKANSAFLFNGRSGFVTVPDSDTLDTDFAFTLSAWINPKAYKDENGYSAWIISKWYSSPTHGDYALQLNAETGQLVLSVCRSHPAKLYDGLGSPKPIAKNTWTHVAATFNRGKMHLYVNGMLVNKRVSTKVKCLDPAEYVHDDVCIGGLWDDNYNFDGRIDDVGIWNRALSGDEIAQLAGAPEVKRVSSKAVGSSGGCAEVRDTDELSTLDSKQIEQGEKP